MKSIQTFVHDALLSIAFFQIVLTPVQIFIIELSMHQYGVWAILNIPISTLLGPLFLATMRWIKR